MNYNGSHKGCYARTPAAVPMMIMNVRGNKANVTIMTATLRMKKMIMTGKIRYERE